MTKYVSKPTYVNAILVKEAIDLFSKSDWNSIPKWLVKEYDQGTCIFTPQGIHIPESYGLYPTYRTRHKKYKVAELDEILVLDSKGELNSFPVEIFEQYYVKVEE